MRELTKIELDTVSGGLDGMPVWMNTITKYIQNVPINVQGVAADNHGWQGFGNFIPQFNVSPVNNNI